MSDKEESANHPENVDGDSSMPANLGEAVRSAVLSVVQRIRFDESSPHEKGKRHPHAFEIGEAELKDLCERVAYRFSELDDTSYETVSFSALVRFPDLTTKRFNDFNALIREAGHERDPETLVLEWKQLLLRPYATTATVNVLFQTEAPLETQELSALQHNISKMELSVRGPTEAWVDGTFRAIDPYLETARIGSIYKPLLLFRNKEFTHIFSMVTAVIIQVAAYTVVFESLQTVTKQERYDQIVSKPTLDEKFLAYMSDTLLGGTSVIDLMVSMGAAAGLFLATLVGGFYLFPKLVPRSAIEIGLARTRFQKYQNAFRFVIFSVGVSGIVLPIIMRFLG